MENKEIVRLGDYSKEKKRKKGRKEVWPLLSFPWVGLELSSKAVFHCFEGEIYAIAWLCLDSFGIYVKLFDQSFVHCD